VLEAANQSGYQFIRTAIKLFHPAFVRNASKVCGDYPTMKVGDSFEDYYDKVQFHLVMQAYNTNTDCDFGNH